MGTGADIARAEWRSIWIVILPADGTTLPDGRKTSVRHRLMGSFRTNHCLPSESYMGWPNVNHNSGSRS
jgi:hypothetical protein